MMNNANMQQDPTLIIAENKVRIARANLLLVIGITLLNVLMAAFKSETYLLFSAQFPLFLVYVGLGFENATALIVSSVMAVVAIIPYFLCWLFSKKHYGWMIGALCYFALDCLFLLLLFDFTMIVDLLFHAWIVYYLIIGIKYGHMLKEYENKPHESAPVYEGVATEAASTPLEGSAPATEGDYTPSQEEAPANGSTPALRSADLPEGTKVKLYVEAEHNGHKIAYRRVGKSTEELVIDDTVYAEFPRQRGVAYGMTATLDGVEYAVGTNGNVNQIFADGKLLKFTARFF